MAADSLPILHALDRLKSDAKLLQETAQIAKDSASSHGLLLKDAVADDVFTPVPITLLPSLVPVRALKEIVGIQDEINLLQHRVAHDREFLKSTLAGVASVDPFIKNLLDIYDQIDIDSKWELEFTRSDYLLHCPPESQSEDFLTSLKTSSYKQVEVNMICIAFAGLSSKMPQVHRRVLSWLKYDVKNSDESGDVLSIYGRAVRSAQEIYAKSHPMIDGKKQVLLTVIHEGERNTMDQRMIEFESGLVSLRRTFKQIAKTAKLDGGRLFVEGYEVAVIYYRTGYAPPHYQDEQDWSTRLLLEKSDALKCPSVAHQLSGFKKIQQELSKDAVLARFVPDADLRRRMLATCVGQWDLSSPDSAEPVKRALAHPELFVLKPNREGGGNNFFDGDMIQKINEVIGTEQAKEFILMERIVPPFQENFLIRPAHPPALVPTISEVGVFGVFIARGNEIALNTHAKDVLVRSKANNVNEGGVATGYACLSSAYISQ